MMRNVIIIGNSGAALECYTLLKTMLALPSLRTVFSFKGFLSHKGYKGNLGLLQNLEIGSDEDYCIQDNDVFALGIGNNLIRFEAFNCMKAKGGMFINLISPWALIDEDVQIGEGNIISLGCSISNRVSLGDANYFNGSVCIGHGVNIENANFMGQGSMIMGETIIGSFNNIAPSAMIMDKCKVGDNNDIAPASVIYKGCKNNCLMAGNPAVKLRTKETIV